MQNSKDIGKHLQSAKSAKKGIGYVKYSSKAYVFIVSINILIYSMLGNGPKFYLPPKQTNLPLFSKPTGLQWIKSLNIKNNSINCF